VADARLARTGFSDLDFLPDQNFGPAGFVEADGVGHGITPHLMAKNGNRQPWLPGRWPWLHHATSWRQAAASARHPVALTVPWSDKPRIGRIDIKQYFHWMLLPSLLSPRHTQKLTL
jgi:hypothetical protein